MSLIVKNKDLTVDFDSYIAERTLSNPKKKTIKESIPLSNVTYDFSDIDGEIYFEERDLTYTIDIAETSTEAMEEKRASLFEWLAFVQNEDIYDPYFEGFHFRGSFDSDSWSEDFGAGELEVTFKVYPYKIADFATSETFDLVSGENTISIDNVSSHPIVPTFNASASMNVTIGGRTFALASGESSSPSIKLAKGSNALVVNASEAGTLTISYIAEVL